MKANTNTIVHETVHVVDKFHDVISSFDFTHRGNKPHKPPQNQDSAPYWIGNRSQELLPLLQENNKGQSGSLALDALELEIIQKSLTEKNWAKDEHFFCGTHAIDVD